MTMGMLPELRVGPFTVCGAARQFFLPTVLAPALAVLCACRAGDEPAAELVLQPLGSDRAPPLAAARPRVRDVAGLRVEDEYLWLENLDDPRVGAHLEAENEFFRAAQRPHEGLAREIVAELLRDTAVQVPDRRPTTWRRGAWDYSSEASTTGITVRRGRSADADGSDSGGTLQVVLELRGDPTRADSHSRSTRLELLVPDPGHRQLAWSAEGPGINGTTVQFQDLERGVALPDRLHRVWELVWWGAEQVLYTELDSNGRPARLRVHRLGTDRRDDELLHEELDPDVWLELRRSRSERFAFLDSAGPSSRAVRALDLDQNVTRLRTVCAKQESVRSYVEHQGDRFLVLERSTATRLLEVPLRGTATEQRTLIAARADVEIGGFDVFAEHLVLYERESGRARQRVFDLRAGGVHAIEPPIPHATVEPLGDDAFDGSTLRVRLSTPSHPEVVYDYDLRERTWRDRSGASIGGQGLATFIDHDPANFIDQALEVPTQDGSAVRLHWSHARHVDPATAPWLVEIHGLDGVERDARFESDRLPLLRRGVVVAQLFLEPWDQPATSPLPNERAWESAEEGLLAGWAAVRELAEPQNLAVLAEDRTATLVLSAMGERRLSGRDLLLRRPLLDPVATLAHHLAPLPGVEWERPPTADDLATTESLHRRSPYERARSANWPHTLITVDADDAELPPWHGAKWTARLRRRVTDEETLRFLQTVGPDPADACEARAREWCFVLTR